MTWPAAQTCYAAHVSRALNSHADSWANLALDCDLSASVWHADSCSAFLQELLNLIPGHNIGQLVANFDGASRGNPGPASCGGVLRYLRLNSDGAVLNEYVLWEGCGLLGVETSFSAEMMGAKFVLQQVL